MAVQRIRRNKEMVCIQPDHNDGTDQIKSAFCLDLCVFLIEIIEIFDARDRPHDAVLIQPGTDAENMLKGEDPVISGIIEKQCYGILFRNRDLRHGVSL